ncbi:hypothetical protein Cob_v005855 [Colletotrichum orbiculare MAFF 240422]|uniref:Uncharacterized protein n=1 Tax=Colletotrichum orbiculare (strain 104-T / ATCC 96160 / CBS 514.97 / LARS 414 / MAFF 240422) TaxID=1213857 RepID=A0A484FUC1_COLOR|nr:hypothetical protein Cob_v005855 [Colletotrichum orbiculare MAFF 240422]
MDYALCNALARQNPHPSLHCGRLPAARHLGAQGSNFTKSENSYSLPRATSEAVRIMPPIQEGQTAKYSLRSSGLVDRALQQDCVFESGLQSGRDWSSLPGSMRPSRPIMPAYPANQGRGGEPPRRPFSDEAKTWCSLKKLDPGTSSFPAHHDVTML